MSGDIRKSTGKYDDMSLLKPSQPIDYPSVDYIQTPSSSFDSQPPPPNPPLHGSRENSYAHSDNLESEPPSDEELVKNKTKKSFTNLFQKKKNSSETKQQRSDRKTRSRAASRASQASNEIDPSFAQSAYAYYPPAMDPSRAKQPPSMKTTEIYASPVRSTTPASIANHDQIEPTSPSIDTTPRHLKTKSMQDPARALAELQRELNIKRQMLEQYHQENRRLAAEKESLYATIEKRDVERQKLLQNFDEYLQSVRATPDTLVTISDRIRALKSAIQEFVDDVVAKADKKRATKVLRDDYWINMSDEISKLGSPLKRKHIAMLTKKYIMDQLVQCVFLLVSYPGLPIDQAYTDLYSWVEEQDVRFAGRLRQEMARVVAGRQKGDDTDMVIRDKRETLVKFLCKRMCLAFPFIESHDKSEPDPAKKYVVKIRRIVIQAYTLLLAMKGQEVDITTGQILVDQPFDASIMDAEEGKNAGTVRFLIYPPFVDRLGRRRFLEKALVYCD
ncbi:hypothetical protein Unana1_05778 [Umbelopsis nana]